MEAGWWNRLFLVSAVYAAVLAAPAVAPAQPPPGLGSLTWSDEFTGTTLDPTHWTYRATGPRDDGLLLPTAVSVGGGVLTIKTHTDTVGNHHSGMVSSQPIGPTTGFAQTYGY